MEVRHPRLIPLLGLWARMALRTLNHRVRRHPAQPRAKDVTEIDDREIRDPGLLERRPPRRFTFPIGFWGFPGLGNT